MTSVIEEIAAERRRQIASENWTPEHDDMHDRGEMADAAASYILNGSGSPHPAPDGAVPTWWPWCRSWWKPTTRRRDLIKAAALIVVEIERLDRAEARKKD